MDDGSVTRLAMERQAGAPAILELPLDRPRAVHRSAERVAARCSLPAPIAGEPALALAAVAAWLQRLTGQADVVVSLERDGALLPLRLDLSGDPPWSALRARAADTLADPPAPVAPEEADGAIGQVVLRLDGPAVGTAVTELALGLEGTEVHAEAAGGLFEAATLERLLGHLGRLAAGARDELTVSALPLLGDDERALVLEAWNATERPFADGATVHELIAATAARLPDKIAVADERTSLTYAELEERANRLAHHLIGLGAGPDGLVGIHLDRGHELAVATLATMKAGAAYVPLDPGFPPDRLAYMAEDSGLGVLITADELAGRLALAPGVREVRLDGDAAAIAAHPATAPDGGATARDRIYVIYTSGSTGKPKGVVLEHRSVVNFLESMAEEPGFGEDDVLLAVTTLSFDIAGLELYLPLLQGGTVVVASRAATVDPAKLLEDVARHDVTVMQATPATWRMMADGGWEPGSTPRLRAFCGGEALPPALAARLLERTAETWNLYGPTETTIWSTVQRVGPGFSGSIGHPIANTTLRVLDAHRGPVPIGVAGELYIGGDGLARGYHERDELTAERFVPDPFAGEGARMYRTGDLVRWRDGGRLEFLGRVDHQVKVRGFRIELGEIEVVLGRHPDVEEAIVVARDAGEGDKRLVAFLTLADGATASRTDLRRAVQDELPHYMVPSAVVVLDEMPRTPNGKTDRNALPEVDWSDVERDVPFVAPRDELEERLAVVWEEVLGISPLGVDDDLFTLGVDSLTTARLVGRIERDFATHLPVGALFSAPTVATLAGLLRDGVDRPRWRSLVPINPMTPGAVAPPVFCVHGGAGTILLYAEMARRLGPERPVYGLHAQGLYGRDPVHTSVADMAAAYLEQMREVQPLGPYTILGYCFGGHVAHELAVRLRAAGEEVALVGYINAPAIEYIHRHKPLFDDESAITGEHGVRLRGWTTTPAKPVSRPRKAVRRMRRRARDVRFRAAIRFRRPLPESMRENLSFQRIAHRAERDYAPPALDAPAVVWRAEGLYFEDDLGWGAHVRGPLHCVEIAGEQATPRRTMMEPFVGQLVDSLLELLEGPAAPGEPVEHAVA